MHRLLRFSSSSRGTCRSLLATATAAVTVDSSSESCSDVVSDSGPANATLTALRVGFFLAFLAFSGPQVTLVSSFRLLRSGGAAAKILLQQLLLPAFL